MDATRFVEEVLSLGVASREQIDAAAQQPSSWRTLPARLVEQGCERGDVLAAVSSALGLPPAPPSVLRTSSYASDAGLSIDAWRALVACPLAASDGVVLLTTSLEAITQAQACGVTPVRVFAALEIDVEDALQRAEAQASADAHDVVHDAMAQIELAAQHAADVLGVPGAQAAGGGSLPAPERLALDLDGRVQRTPGSVGPGLSTAELASPPNTSPASRDPPSGSVAALSDPSADDSLLERAAASGERLCGYDIYEELGRGASAVVFRARRPGESYDVALKIITKETAKNPAFPQRFKREIRAQASLTHANIVHVVDYGREDGWYFLATEYLPGGTLEELIALHGPLPGAVAVLVLDEVLRGIAFAQTRGVVHRDLKPGNLLLAQGGRIKIGDFGLARMDLDPNKSSFGTVQGTPAYMSPEQALGLEIDGRSDLFTLATIVYELVTGTNPYRRDLGPATLMAVAQARPLNLFDVAPSVPLELDEAVHRMSHKDLERRPASAEEVLTLLAPAVQRVSRRWPGLLESYLHAPADTRRRLAAELAADEVALAAAALESGDEKLRPRAALAVVRALSHAPNDADALAFWDTLSEAFQKGEAERPELVAVEQQIVETPDDPRLLRRASELARGEGNVLKQAMYLRRYLRVGPKDTLAIHQLSLLLPDEQLAPPAAPDAGRIATPTTSPVAPTLAAMTPSPPPQPTTTPTPPPSAAVQPAAIPSARAPRVVGTGADSQAVKHRRSPRALVAAALGLVVVLLVVAAWRGLRDDAASLITAAASERVQERVEERAAPRPVVENPFEQRQRAALNDARSHLRAGRLDEAIDAFTRAIDLDPGSRLATEGWLGRADAHAKRGDKESAAKQYRRILELTSEGVYGHAEATAALQRLGVPLEAPAE